MSFANFTELFRRATGNSNPFPYQVRFAEAGELPEVIHAPTGAGKTATAVLGWLWRYLYAGKVTPRRLVYCLPMRVLVEQTRDESRKWLDNVGLRDKVGVHVLMGGEESEEWDLDPEKPAVLIGTQDMLLSRALNRGYGMGRFRWPMHFGLLNNDALWVLDEIQLMGTGLATSTQLQAFREALGLFAHSADTVEGAQRHERVDARSGELPGADELQDSQEISARGVQLSSEMHRLTAKMDLIDASDGRVTPIDYKKGRPKETDAEPEAWPADRAQLAIQAIVLRDSGYRCDEGILYYAATKQRVRVAIDDALVASALATVAEARAIAEGGRIPPPLADSPKCPRCSLVGICLPDETAFIETRRRLVSDTIQPWLIEPPADDEVGDAVEPARRLVPARDDLRPLYVVGQGLSVGRSGEVLQVRDRERRVIQEARLMEVSQVNLFGNVTISAPALQSLCTGEKPLAHFSSGGWFYGLTIGLGARNAFLRAEQFARASQPAFCRTIAGRIVGAKIRNQRTLLRRNHVEPPRRTLDQLNDLADAAERALTIEQLLGIEGAAARSYFEQFGGMLKVDGDTAGFRFEHRNRRPPRDPVNAMLSLLYSLLSKDLTVVCAAVGLDPFWGFYHQPRYGRPALALDLMEMFRPLIADSTVLTAINTQMVDERSFVRTGGAVVLTPAGRKAVLRAYEQRMDGLVTHPVFEYRVSYRRVLEIQTRLLARFVCGEISEYPTFETR